MRMGKEMRTGAKVLREKSMAHTRKIPEGCNCCYQMLWRGGCYHGDYLYGKHKAVLILSVNGLWWNIL